MARIAATSAGTFQSNGQTADNASSIAQHQDRRRPAPLKRAIPQRVADDETGQGDAQPHQPAEVALAQRYRQARGVATHEGNEVAGGEETDGVGHACQYRQPGHQAEPTRPRVRRKRRRRALLPTMLSGSIRRNHPQEEKVRPSADSRS